MKIRALSVAILTVLTLVFWAPAFLHSQGGGDGQLYVHFLDVGQGDAIFVETPHGRQLLIDGGPDSGVLRELSVHMSLFDRTIDVLVGTHPDRDHIGGLTDVLERYAVSAVVRTENKSDTAVSDLYETLLSVEGAEVVYARRGQSIRLDASTTLHVLFPELDATGMESNASSIVVRLVYGDTSFLLTGDSPKRIEEYLVLAEGEHLQSDVLKVGHHGSRTSTSELFLNEVQPEFAVISASSDNSYGHPHVEVTDMLFNKGVTTLHTADEGTITFVSDGTQVRRK